MILRTWVLLFVVAATMRGQPPRDAWLPVQSVDSPCGNLSFVCNVNAGKGSSLRIAFTDKSRRAVLELDRSGGQMRCSPADAFDPAVTDGLRAVPRALAVAGRGDAQALLKVRPGTWTLYLNGRQAACFPAPMDSSFDVLIPRANQPSSGAQDVYFQKTADFEFADRFLVPVDDENKLAAWDVLAGDWHLHSVTDTAIERGNLDGKSAKPPLPDHSPNFSSLKVAGTNALIVSGYEFHDDYELETALECLPGEAGLAFYLGEKGDGYAFTIAAREDSDRVLLRLRHFDSTNDPAPQAIAAVTREFLTGQWCRIGVRVAGDRVVCSMDGIDVIDRRLNMPPGGRFGLRAAGSAGVRFDDFRAASYRDIEPETMGDLRRRVWAQEGTPLPRASWFRRVPDRAPAVIEPSKARTARWLAIGTPEREKLVLSADFQPLSESWTAGLLAGYRTETEPHWRFTCRRTGVQEIFRLERVDPQGPAELVEELVLPAADDTGRPLRLLCDAGNGRELRFYRNDKLVLVHVADEPHRGTGGLYWGPRSVVRVSNLSLRSRRDLHRNRFEKQGVFVSDNFMRNWSSPEGQWIQTRDGKTWYKGDFFGRFAMRMPLVAGSAIHLGVGEHGEDGEIVLRVSDKDFTLHAAGASPDAEPLVLEPLRDAFETGNEQRWYTLHYENQWVWAMTGGDLLWKQRLRHPLQGARVRIEGFSTNQLKHSRVDRYGVMDFLFTESLHAWLINGGQWDVVNRFNCDPRWSHMNGESKDGLAALWSKYAYKGDFCVEMYAGMRQAWYDRAGDLNLTIMNRGASTGRGYTVTCAGWDRDHSQLYTRLYREGRVMAESDRYTVPRNREGAKRHGYTPLVEQGRDLHGAWYYIKFRRIGKKLEYWFDNELVLQAEDEDPLQAGSFGIWTFMNSMMVARVKVAAQDIRLSGFDFRKVAPDTQPESLAAPAVPARDPVALNHGRALDMMSPDLWKTDDPTGRGRLEWHAGSGGQDYFVFRNRFGGGGVPAACTIDGVDAAQLAGWRFYVKRTPGARFNFHYSLGRRDSKGHYVPAQRCFHRLTGPDFSRGRYTLSGRTDVPAINDRSADWHAQGDWTPVHVWLPRGKPFITADPLTVVKVEGFGIEQPGYELQGLTGNGPGDGYAVRGFSEIWYRPPSLSSAADLHDGPWTLADPVTGKQLETGTLDGLQSWFRNRDEQGLVQVMISGPKDEGCRSAELAWVGLPAEPQLECGWSPKVPDALELRGTADYPDPRLADARVLVGGVECILEPAAADGHLVLLPRIPGAGAQNASNLSATVTCAGRETVFDLARADRATNRGPVLIGIEGAVQSPATFEGRDLAVLQDPGSGRTRLLHGDTDQGSFLEIANPGRLQRMQARFKAGVSLCEFPLLQFRYRAEEMARVGLGLGRGQHVRLYENGTVGKRAGTATDFVRDGTWRTWYGRVSDVVQAMDLTQESLRVNELEIASQDNPDQTGLFSTLHVDDLVFGAAVRTGEEMAFTPRFFDSDGVREVHLVVRPGAENYHALTESELGKLEWRSVPCDERIVPELDNLPDGAAHLLLKAFDLTGVASPVTDVPLLIDRQPMTARHEFTRVSNPVCNGTILKLMLGTLSGAPFDSSTLKMLWDGTPVKLDPMGSSLEHGVEQDVLSLNWTYVFRNQLNASTNGQSFSICVAGIRDGAGNVSPDLAIERTVDYSADRTSPTLLAPDFSDRVLWCGEPVTWIASRRPAPPARREEDLEIIRQPGQEPRMELRMQDGKVSLVHAFVSPGWSLDDYPCLAFRVRRPKYRDDTATRFKLLLNVQRGPTYKILLSDAAKGRNELSLPQPLEWRANEWCTVRVNLRSLFKQQLPKVALKDLKIGSLGLECSGTNARESIHLQNFFVFAPWTPADKVRLRAFDESGIAGLEFIDGTKAGGLEFAPAAAAPATVGEGWIPAMIRDKAGNLSLPVRVPWWPAGQLEAGSPSG